MRRSQVETAERILLYGHAGSGKSTAAVDLVRDGQDVLVLDTEGAWGRMSAPAPNLAVVNLPQLARKEEVSPWVAFIGQLKLAAVGAGFGDWIVVDSCTALWSWCQNHYMDTVYQVDGVDYLLKRREEMEAAKKIGNPLDGNHDWTYINRLYNEFVNQILLTDAHVLLTAEQQIIDDRVKDPNVLKDWGWIGYRPAGQKSLPHLPHTILHTVKRTNGWVMEPVKDRGRQDGAYGELDVSDGFTAAYLEGVAGWQQTSRRR